jgi:immune inhibitor A
MYWPLMNHRILDVIPAIAIIAYILITCAPSTATAIPPQPGMYDPRTGLSITNGYPPPNFPAWFGKGLRPVEAVSGEGRVVALLVDFPDRQANTIARPDSFFNDLLFSLGTHPTGSFRDFYIEQSYGIFDVTGEAYGWIRTLEDYYTTYDDGNYGLSGGGQGVLVAAMLLSDPTIDFGAFDSDGPDGIPNSGDDDGVVDACVIFCSGLGGHDTYNPSDMWPHASGIFPPFETNDPRSGGGFIMLEGYSIQPEINLNAAGDDTLSSQIGVVAHEYGHQLGLADYYDPSQKSWGIGYWGLMGYGSMGALRTGPYHLSAWNKVQLGWVTPTVVTENLLDITIPPVETDPVIYKVWRDGIPGEEYFLLENRQNLGFDTFLPGSGLLIWHIDESMFQTGLKFSGEETTADGWFRVALEQADGREDLATWFSRPDVRAYYPEMGDGGDPFPGDSLNSRFDDYSTPSSRDNAGLSTDVSIVDISIQGDSIRLSIVIDSTVAVYFTSFHARAIRNHVELSWDVSADEPIEGFQIYRRHSESDLEIPLLASSLVPPERRHHVDREVHPGESYRYTLAAVKPDGSELRSAPVDASIRTVSLTLYQNYPNPFNPTTTISFYLPRQASVNLSIYNVEGRLINTLKSEILSEGFTRVEWDGKDDQGVSVSSGIYLYRLKAGKRMLTKKMVLIR